MSTSKKNIYAESYTTKPVDNAKSLEQIRKRKVMAEQKKMGLLLQEEQSKCSALQLKLRRITEDNRRLKLTITKLEQEAKVFHRR